MQGTSNTRDTLIADSLGLPWWAVWYQFLLLVAIAVLASIGALRKSGTVLGNFLAASFALHTYLAHQAATLVRQLKDADAQSKYTARAEAMLAGIILTALSTALLVIWLGSLDTVMDIAGQSGKKPPTGMHHFAPVAAESRNASYNSAAPMMPPPHNGSYNGAPMPPPHNGSYNGAPMMPPPPVGVGAHPGHHSPPPLPPHAPAGAHAPPEYGSSPAAHPLPGTSSPPGDHGYAEQSF